MVDELGAEEGAPQVLFGISYQEGGLYYGVCLNRFLMTVTDSPASLAQALQDMVDAHIEACEETGRVPFEGLHSAPKKYWDMWLDRFRHQHPRLELLEPSGHRPAIQFLEAAQVTFEEVVDRLRQRYEEVEVRTTGSGTMFLMVDDCPPLPIPEYFGIRYSESPVSDDFLEYLWSYYPSMSPTDLGLDWLDED